jgi:hypothetical protein
MALDVKARQQLATDITQYGSVTITASATAEQLPNKPAKAGVFVSASLDNGVDIYVGGNNTVSNSNYAFRLQPGDRTPLLPIANLNQVWVYAVFTAETHNMTYWVM